MDIATKHIIFAVINQSIDIDRHRLKPKTTMMNMYVCMGSILYIHGSNKNSCHEKHTCIFMPVTLIKKHIAALAKIVRNALEYAVTELNANGTHVSRTKTIISEQACRQCFCSSDSI